MIERNGKMRVFRRAQPERTAQIQMRSSERHPFGAIDGYVPLRSGEIQLYRTIREAVPLVDAAIVKLIRLTGGFEVRCADKGAERDLAEFLRNVNTGRGQRGIQSFVDMYLDSMLTCGRAVGEMVLDRDRQLAAVLCGNAADIEIKEGTSPLDFTVCGKNERGAS